MRHMFLYFSLILGIALSLPACGSSTTPVKRRTTTAPTDAVELPPPAGPMVVFPVVPGAGEQSAINAGNDELGSVLVEKNKDGRYVVAQDRTVCDPDTKECREAVDRCAVVVATRILAFDDPEKEPTETWDVTLRDGEAVSVATDAPYVGVEMRAGVCVDSERLATPLDPGALLWCFPDSGHERSPGNGKRCEDMATCGGSPTPNCKSWYTVPVVPKQLSAVSVAPAVFAPVSVPAEPWYAECNADWKKTTNVTMADFQCPGGGFGFDGTCTDCERKARKKHAKRACNHLYDPTKKEYYWVCKTLT